MAVAALLLVAVWVRAERYGSGGLTAAAAEPPTTLSAVPDSSPSTSLGPVVVTSVAAPPVTRSDTPMPSIPLPTTTVASTIPAPPLDTTTTTTAPRPRAAPAIVAHNESYAVEVIGQFQRYSAEDLGGFIRRHDLKGAWGEGPDGYGAAGGFGWRGTFGRRCLTGTWSGNLSVPGEPLHMYLFGVVGLDAERVELVWDDGRRVEATLGVQTFAVPVRWWIAGYDTAEPDAIVATDPAGGTWIIPRAPATGFIGGQVDC